MKLSIIIVNFNTPKLTLDCLQSILCYLNEEEGIEIILVDNAPKVDYEISFKNVIPNLIYLKSKTNIGFGKANNWGMNIAKGKYFFLLNSDTLLVDNSIINGVNFLDKEENKNIGVLGPMLLNPDFSVQISFYPHLSNTVFNYFKSNNPLLYKLFRMNTAFVAPNKPSLVGDVSGAAMLLRSQIFENTGGFDPDFFLYCEETEWCRNRISKQNQILYFPFSKIVHLGGQSAPKGLMSKQAQISQALFWYKCGHIKYSAFIVASILNCIFYVTTLLFMKRSSRMTSISYIHSVVSAIPYWLFKIPQFNRRFGSRPSGLIFEPAKAFFFDN